MNAGQIYVHLRADIANLQKGMRTAQGIVARFASRAGKLIMGIPWAKMALAATAAIGGIAFAFKKFTGSVIQAASTSENYRVRLKALLGSAQEGNRLFKEMSDFASKVPFSYEKIMGSATALAGVMKGGVDEIKRWMPLIADLAAVSGLSIEDTTSQVIRMYSAGAASADMFRERGILAMLGFKAGVSYSVEDTRKMMFSAWNSTTSKFKGATKELAKTWDGLMSMFGDLWFNFKNMIAKSGMFDSLKGYMKDLLDWLNELKDNGTLQQWAQMISDAIMMIINKVIEFGLWIYENWKEIVAKFYEVKKAIEEYIKPPLEFIWKLFKMFLGWLKENLPWIREEFLKFLKVVDTEIKPALEKFFAEVQKNLKILQPLFKLLEVAIKVFVTVLKIAAKFVGGVITVYSKLVSVFTKPVRAVIEFLGKGSSERPLTEKLSELSGKVNSFTSHINSQNPMYNVDITSAMNKLSAVAQRASQVSSAISKSGGGGAYKSNYGLWTGEGGIATLGPDEYLKQTEAGIVIAHNPKPKSAIEGDKQREENIINANVSATVEVSDVSKTLAEYNRRIS